jgi:integrase/recombinase XerD
MDIIYLVQKEALRRGMSHRTVKAYSDEVKKFFDYCKKEPRRITKKDIREYLDYLVGKGKSGSSLNIALSALKFMISEILFKTWRLGIKYSRRPKSLPVVLSKQEVVSLFQAIENKKHKLIVSLMYSAGLRLSEVVHLKAYDIEEGYGWVRKGKGNKDRLFVIADKLKDELKELIANLDGNEFLFKGNKGTHISQNTIYLIVKRAGKKSGIKKNVHPHTLRHSFATHLIENGYDISLVQRLMGHNSLETTKGYIHLAFPKINVKSPLDSL